MTQDMSVHSASDPLRLLDASARADAPPPALLPFQQRWVADPAQLKIAEKGRRIGLTWAEAADDVLIAAAAGGSKVFYISATEDMAREYIEACAMWAKVFNRAASEIAEGVFADSGKDGAERRIKTFEITLPASGHRIVALSSRPTNLRGKQGVIVLDEAAFAPDLAGLLKAALAMLMWGDRVRIISTHDGAENAFKMLIDEVRAGKRGAATVHTIPFRLAVSEGLYRRVCLRKGRTWSQAAEDQWVAETYAFYGADAEEELDAIPARSGGKYLSLALLAERMTVPAGDPRCTVVRGQWDEGFEFLAEDMRRFAIDGWLREHVAPALARLDPLRRHVFGMDFARSSHLSSIWVLDEDVELVHRPRLVVELRNCPFACQDQILYAVVDGLPRFRGGAMDAGGNGAATAERAAQRYGSQMVEQVKLSQAWYALHMPRLKAALQDGTLTDLPRDELIQSDLRAVEVIKGIPMVPATAALSAAAKAAAAEAGAKGQQRHGDSAIALCFGEFAFRREAGEVAWTPAPGGAGARRESASAVGAQRWRMRADDEADDLADMADRMGGAW